MSILILQIFNGNLEHILRKTEDQFLAIKSLHNSTECVLINMGDPKVDFSTFKFKCVDLRSFSIPNDYWEKKKKAIMICEQLILQTNPQLVYMRYPLGDEFTLSLVNKYDNIVFEHHTKEEEELHTYYDKSFYKKEVEFGPQILRKSLAIVGVTKSIVDYEIKRAGLVSKSKFVHLNGINSENTGLFHKQKPLLPINLLSVSSFQPWHGLDRIIKGLGNYTSPEEFRISLVGSGPCLNEIKSLIHERNLSDYVSLPGNFSSKEIAEIAAVSHLAVGSLGLHRIGLEDACPIKHREFCLLGLPILFSCLDDDFPDSLPFIYRVSADDKPIDFSSLKEFIIRLNENLDLNSSIMQYGINKLSWESKARELLSFLSKLLPQSKSSKQNTEPNAHISQSRTATHSKSPNSIPELTPEKIKKLAAWDKTIVPVTSEIANIILKHLPPNGVLVDIGANTGVATQLVLEKIACKAYLFEPVPLYFQYCKQKFSKSQNVFVENLAVSDEEGFSQIWIDEKNLGWNTMEREKCTNNMQNIPIQTIPFDKYASVNNITSIDVIKIDVEGAEYRVLKGMRHTISKLKRKPVIICEVGWGLRGHPHWEKEIEEFEWLFQNGYQRVDYNVTKTSDIVFVPTNSQEISSINITSQVSSPRLTVGIPTRNRLDSLINLIVSITKQTFKDFELIIADDGDKYNLEYEISSRFPDLQFKIIQGKRISLPINRQTILNNAKTDYVLMCDDDHYMRTNCIEVLYDTAIKTNAGIVSAIWPAPDAITIDYEKVKHLEEYRMDLDNIDQSSNYWWKNGWKTFAVFHNEPKLIESQFAGGGCVLYRKSVIEKVGGFPDYYSSVSFREDTDISYRVFLSGYKVVINPNAIAYHLWEKYGGCRDGLDIDKKREFDGNKFIEKVLEWRKKSYDRKNS